MVLGIILSHTADIRIYRVYSLEPFASYFLLPRLSHFHGFFFFVVVKVFVCLYRFPFMVCESVTQNLFLPICSIYIIYTPI